MAYASQCPTLVYEVIPDHFDPDSDVPPLVALKDKLEHLQALNVDALCLTPIFPASDALRLNTTDYGTIDPALGSVEDLEALCRAADERGIGVVLMGVFDHISADHDWFTWAQAQTEDDGRFTPEQRTRRFFHFGDEHPEGYASRGNVPDQPEVDLSVAEVRRRLFTGEQSVLHRWLHRGIAGWRILHADAVGYSVLREVSRGSLTVEGEHFLIGDIKGFADRYVKDGILDGVVNHYLREAVTSYLRGQIPARQLARVLRDLSARYHAAALNRSWNLLSGHDTVRLTDLVQDPGRARLGTLLKFTLPGCTHILYGDEVGLRARRKEVGALKMTWDEKRWDQSMFDLHQRMGHLRKTQPALSQGEFVDLTPEGEEEILAFARVTADPRATVLVAINRASQTRVRKLFAPVCDLPDGLKLRDVLSGKEATVRSGTITLEIDGSDARILVPDEEDPAGARFFRGY
jgi:4-alpha-glucanotransferase